MPIVSVIIPNYNHATFLEERIESVLRQSFTDFEIILLDDASTDGSISILNKYKDNSRVTALIINETNSGNTFTQWQKGIKLSKGEFIWIAESDDSSDPLFLETCVHTLSSDESLALVVTESTIIDDNNQTVETTSYFKKLPDKLNGKDMIAGHMLFENHIKNASAVVFRKSSCSQVDFLKITNYRWCGDWAFWNYLLLTGNAFFIKRPLNKFRRHATATSNRFYLQGYLFKEGWPLVLFFADKIDVSFSIRLKMVGNWILHLVNQYAERLRKGKFGIVLFSPGFFLLHIFAILLLPFALIRRIFIR